LRGVTTVQVPAFLISNRADPSSGAGERLVASAVGSKPAGCMDVCLLRIMCVVRHRSLRWNEPSSRALLPSACVCFHSKVPSLSADRLHRS
jgi:hypothetical protein